MSFGDMIIGRKFGKTERFMIIKLREAAAESPASASRISFPSVPYYMLQPLDFLGGEAGGLGNLPGSHHVHGLQLAGKINILLLQLGLCFF